MNILKKSIAFISMGTACVSAQEIDLSFQNHRLPIDQRTEILVSQMTLEEKVSQLLNDAPAIQRLEVPSYNWWNEALHGVARNGKATIFPQAIGLAATFDTNLAKEVASAISTEARAKFSISQSMGNHSQYAGLTFWTPNVNIFRDPRWGRGQETYGEDPFLTSQIGIAFVQGLQGDNPDYLKSAATAKHYAVHSGPEASRHHFNAIPSQQDLYETYLPAFEALVKDANVETVMAAYNAVFDVPANASHFLIQDILRGQWGFDGHVVSDCGAIHGIFEKLKYKKNAAEASAVALKAGVELNCGYSYHHLTEAVEQGLVTEELITQRAEQLFKTRFKLGMFDADQSNNPYNQIPPSVINSKEHRELARKVAQKSIVLLKNDNNILPLSKDIKIPYVTGPFANSADMLMGNYYGISPNLVTILGGISEAVSLGTSLNYRSGALPFNDNLNPKNWAPNVAASADVTIAVVGLSADFEGEEVDAIASANIGDKKDLKLPQNQINYLHQIIEKKKGPLILVVASGSPVSLEGIEEHADAILQIWYPGEQGGTAVADVLFGDVSPSGHLPITFPKNVAQLPDYEDYAMQGRTYKYMTKEPMFPFGFGLTYSETDFKQLTLNANELSQNDSLQVQIEVENIGSYDIEEVVQLYISPEKVTDNLPQTSLKGFQRIALKQGEKKMVTFTVAPEQLKVVNSNGERIWRTGGYQVLVGNSSPSPVSERLGAATPKTKTIKLI
ncbi:glycoside hydrolase family 3 C-terminal domain-containing protein [Vibrio sp. 10N.286.49.B1]|uniref:glycoside hydrolase family 3 C-terminal domain-containing protein n=1 Tax=unclassified Vibrio TaxID=2614977 RepID=UPI0018E4A713|nr:MULTISPECIES: glycoside hydrolase family 3 C-terminal domain-containing protein [unclassified Vibrio]